MIHGSQNSQLRRLRHTHATHRPMRHNPGHTLKGFPPFSDADFQYLRVHKWFASRLRESHLGRVCASEGSAYPQLTPRVRRHEQCPRPRPLRTSNGIMTSSRGRRASETTHHHGDETLADSPSRPVTLAAKLRSCLMGARRATTFVDERRADCAPTAGAHRLEESEDIVDNKRSK